MLELDRKAKCIFAVTEYLKGSNWKVHPDWVYCEYNSLKDPEKDPDLNGDVRDRDEIFNTPEEQILHFLARTGRQGWKWMSVSDLFILWTLATTKVNFCFS